MTKNNIPIEQLFEQLESKLKQKIWTDSNLLTREIVGNAIGKDPQLLLANDVNKLPFLTFDSLDMLWREKSYGQYGFNTQKHHIDKYGYDAFIEKTGWVQNRTWASWDSFQSRVNNVEGVFPYIGMPFWASMADYPEFVFRNNTLEKNRFLNTYPHYPHSRRYNTVPVKNPSNNNAAPIISATSLLVRSLPYVAFGVALIGGYYYLTKDERHRKKLEQQEKERVEREERESKEELKREQEIQKNIENLTNRAVQEYLKYKELDITIREKILILQKGLVVECDTLVKYKLEKQIEEAQNKREEIQKMMRSIAASHDTSI